MENKKVALIFLYFIGAIQLVAGVYTQLVGLFHWDFMSLFPVVEMGTQQILYLNLLAVFLVTTLIHIVVAALVNDGSYGPLDVLQACPPLTIVVPLVLFGISIYTTLGATSAGERVFCLVVSGLYILACYISVGCISAVRDMED